MVLRDYYNRCEKFKATSVLPTPQDNDFEQTEVLLKTLYKGEPFEKIFKKFVNQESVESVFLNRQRKLY